MKQSALVNARAKRSVAALAAVLGMSMCAAVVQAADEQKTGERLFYSLCASCHGSQGRGDGPVAALLIMPPPDLTRMTQRHNGVFPEADVRRVIDGRSGRIPHGTRNMPVWGRQLYFSDKSDDPAARARADKQILLLSEYIRSIQH